MSRASEATSAITESVSAVACHLGPCSCVRVAPDPQHLLASTRSDLDRTLTGRIESRGLKMTDSTSPSQRSGPRAVAKAVGGAVLVLAIVLGAIAAIIGVAS